MNINELEFNKIQLGPIVVLRSGDQNIEEEFNATLVAAKLLEYKTTYTMNFSSKQDPIFQYSFFNENKDLTLNFELMDIGRVNYHLAYISLVSRRKKLPQQITFHDLLKVPTYPFLEEEIISSKTDFCEITLPIKRLRLML